MYEKITSSQLASVDQGWRENVLRDLEVLSALPEEYVHKGPTFDVETKDGVKLKCENYILNLEQCTDAGLAHLVQNAFVGGERAYLVAKDESGRVVGTRVSSLFHERRIARGKEGILVKSKIKIVEKGQGLAWPVEQSFQLFLQFYADTKKMPVIWKIENQNLEKLEEYREKIDVDPEVIRSMEEEQRRWQALYGEGGKLGVMNGKKVFQPKSV